MNRAKRIAATAATGIALASCGSGAHEAGTTATAAPHSPAATTPAPTPTPALPTEHQLRAGLLTAAEIGKPYEAVPPSSSSDSANTTAGGCEELAALLNSPSAEPSAEETSASADFSAGPTGPLVTHALAAEPPASLDRSYKVATEALASCTHLTLTEDGETLSADLAPIHFAEGATAVRLDGTTHGIPFNGYIAIQRISSNVVMTFTFLQIGSGSSQEASHLYTLAADKATKAFPSP